MSDQQKTKEKYAMCMGTFAPCADRFVTAGYHSELSLQAMLEAAASVEEADAIEMDYPFMEPAGTDVSVMKKMLDKAGLKVCTLEVDHYSDPKWKFGALTSWDKALRKEAVEISKNGIETHSISTDPLFVDMDNGDFRLKPGSPALKLGFKQIDMTKIGLTSDFPKRFTK